jgi:hypothetical protein
MSVYELQLGKGWYADLEPLQYPYTNRYQMQKSAKYQLTALI